MPESSQITRRAATARRNPSNATARLGPEHQRCTLAVEDAEHSACSAKGHRPSPAECRQTHASGRRESVARSTDGSHPRTQGMPGLSLDYSVSTDYHVVMKLTSFILRDIDTKLWKGVKARAEKDGHSLRWVLLALLRTYVEGGTACAVGQRQEEPHLTTREIPS